MRSLRPLLDGVLSRLGLDRAVGYTILSRGWNVLSGVLTVLVVTASLTPVQQGFFFTFYSILGFQVVFELGLAFVISQFASHEMVGLKWMPNRTLAGDGRNLARIASLSRFAFTWFSGAALILLVTLVPGGFWFFSSQPAEAASQTWVMPWILLVAAAGGMLLLSPALAFIEGCGHVAEVAKCRLFQFIGLSTALWVTLLLGGKLYAGAVASGTSLVIGSTWLVWRYRRFFEVLARSRVPGVTVSWKSELMPFQWRMAVSSLGGYLGTQLLTPIAFAYTGPVDAGRLGMTMSASSALLGVAFAWMSTKPPIMGRMVAARDYRGLDRVFRHAFLRATLVSFVSVCAAWSIVVALQWAGLEVGNRFLGPVPLALLLLCCVVNVVVYSEAVYLRSHKREPFALPSAVGAVLVPVLALILVGPFGVLGIVVGYASAVFIGLVWATWLFLRLRRRWHAHDPGLVTFE